MEIKSDIQIAQEAHLENIKDVAAKVGVTEDELEMYGKYKAKLSDELIHRVENNEDGKLVLITAINPTPAGEGNSRPALAKAGWSAGLMRSEQPMSSITSRLATLAPPIILRVNDFSCFSMSSGSFICGCFGRKAVASPLWSGCRSRFS